jgi:protocatechuate 3,4-dioxygenase beta subunit
MPVAAEWVDDAARIAKRIGLRRVVRVVHSVRVACPLVVGAVRPMILLPASLLTGLSPSEIESLLAHELAHVRRHDYTVNLAQCVVETLLFYHPAVWWVSRRIRLEREHCCDDIAVAATGDRAGYVRALAAMAEVSNGAPRLAQAATGGALLARVRRLLGLPDTDAPRGPRWLAGAVALALCILAAAEVVTSRAQDKPAALDKDFDAPKVYALDVEVVDKEAGEALPNVALKVRIGNLPRSYTTDARGHALVEYPADATYLGITAEPARYVPKTQSWANSKHSDPIPGTFKLEMERGTTIGGTVTDVAGKPIANVKVEIFLQDKNDLRTESMNFYSRFDAETDRDGRWRCDTVPSGIGRMNFRLAHPDYASDTGMGRADAPPLTDLRALKAVLVMTRGFQIAGRVLDNEGKPIAGAEVVVGGRSYNSHAPQAKTNAQGRFVLKNCKRDPRASVLATAAGRSPELTDVAIDKDRDDVEIRLEPGHALRLRVLGAKGQPLAGARVRSVTWRGSSALGWSGNTDADGRLVWAEAPREAVSYGIYAPGHIQLIAKTLTATDEEQSVTLLPELTVTGTVVDDQTGQPVENFSVVKGWMSRGREAPYWDRNDTKVKIETGKFEYAENVERDGYATRIESDGYLPAESRPIKGEEGTVALAFRLKKGMPLAGTLITPAGKALAGADLLLVTPSSQIIITNGAPTSQTFTLKAKSDEAGAFHMPPQAGKFTLLVLHPEGYAELTPEQLAKPAAFTIQPWGRVEGLVRVGNKLGAGQVVTATPLDNVRHIECKMKADEDGRFVLAFVPPGKANVAIEVKLGETRNSANYGRTQHQHVDVEAGKATQVAIGGTGRPVTGRLVAPAALPAKVEWYYAHSSIATKVDFPKRTLPADWDKMDDAAKRQWNETWRQTPQMRAYATAMQGRKYFPVRLEGDGSFRVDDVPAGNYQLQVSLQQPPSTHPVDTGPVIAAVTQEFTIPEMPTGRSDKAMDLGEVSLTPVKKEPVPAK